jgi:hypothetical protein
MQKINLAACRNEQNLSNAAEISASIQNTALMPSLGSPVSQVLYVIVYCPDDRIRKTAKFAKTVGMHTVYIGFRLYRGSCI